MSAGERSFWLDIKGEPEFTLVELTGVPEDLAEALMNQGMPEQVFDDGYKAARAARPYVSELLYTNLKDLEDVYYLHGFKF